MSPFSIEGFAAGCKAAMNAAEDRQEAARAFLAEAIERHGPASIVAVLDAALPPGASIGEMVVFHDDELTMMYARVPARFQSGVHNHTVFACIGQLFGEEVSTVYERTAEGLRETGRYSSRLGQVTCLPADAIHHIENPGSEVGGSLHLYGGDLPGLAEERSLWDSEDLSEQSFSFPALVRESVKAMHASGNAAGLTALVEAIPSARDLVQALA